MTSAHCLPKAPVVHNYSPNHKPPVPDRPFSNPDFLAPETAFYAHSSPKRQQPPAQRYSELEGNATSTYIPRLRGGSSGKKAPSRPKRRNGARRSKRAWQKLLWVKQKDYPDNYTDPPTFLSHLQRNPRLRPYEFWPLVADSTVIVQHISSVAIFICSFVGIHHFDVSPVSVVSWGSASTILGWILWDFWVGQAEASKPATEISSKNDKEIGGIANGSTISSASGVIALTPSSQDADSQSVGLGLRLTTSNLDKVRTHSRSRSQTSISSAGISPLLSHQPPSPILQANHPATAVYNNPRFNKRLTTIKSAFLIYIALLGLSPILKSLTESTTPDSIWAMSCWLMCINIFFFDYGGGVEVVQFPASLSTNAALMASTVLASRLRSTTHVFSLTLFSIEVFGLFPVFRRHLRHVSWRGHMILTISLMIGAGAGLGLVISGRSFWSGGWKRALAGAVVWAVGSAVGMGGCSWWLIGLQRYKNVVIGPWDPARPTIRGSWD